MIFRKRTILILILPGMFVGVVACNLPPQDDEPTERRIQSYQHDYAGWIPQALDCKPRQGDTKPGDGSLQRMAQTPANGKWFAYREFDDFASQFYLYDLTKGIRYVITHTNRAVHLYDFSFSRHGTHLSFTATPHAAGRGVSEIVTFNLDDMSYSTYGIAGYLYRRPIYVEESGGLLFFSSSPPLTERSLGEVIYRDSVISRPGYFDPEHGESYMPALQESDQAKRLFKALPEVWVVDKTTKEFAAPWGASIFPAEDIGRYIFTDHNVHWMSSEEFRAAKPGESKFSYMTGTRVDISNGEAIAGPPFLMTRDEALTPLDNYKDLPEAVSDGNFIDQFLCLEDVQIK